MMGIAAVEETKKKIRNRLKSILQTFTPAERKIKSIRITRKLLHHSAFKAASAILFYSALPTEVQLKGLIQAALKEGKKVYLPCMRCDTGKLEIFRINNLRTDLKKGPFKIMEPKRYASRRAHADDLDLVIVPGLGFSRNGKRLGRGAGYYDRFLEKAVHVMKIGVAYKEQMIKKIPWAEHDVIMDEVVTD